MERITLDEHSGVPIWIQIRNRILYLIKSGDFKPGQQLPTVRELAIELQINYNTVNKVYKSLEGEGVIESRRGRGTFVSETPDTIADVDHSPITMLAEELVIRAREVGMTKQDILDLVEKRFKQEESAL